jgi:hypothetical protein
VFPAKANRGSSGDRHREGLVIVLLLLANDGVVLVDDFERDLLTRGYHLGGKDVGPDLLLDGARHQGLLVEDGIVLAVGGLVEHGDGVPVSHCESCGWKNKRL